jgi:hypothetical protein
MPYVKKILHFCVTFKARVSNDHSLFRRIFEVEFAQKNCSVKYMLLQDVRFQ